MHGTNKRTWVNEVAPHHDMKPILTETLAHSWVQESTHVGNATKESNHETITCVEQTSGAQTQPFAVIGACFRIKIIVYMYI
mmetsp:Transcript_7980/g.16020  ORF Transcript_7980/g.16020 Transcript_7980/m.16020 type:complete len:82 (-) Transcript_7980:1309-1554(-)